MVQEVQLRRRHYWNTAHDDRSNLCMEQNFEGCAYECPTHRQMSGLENSEMAQRFAHSILNPQLAPSWSVELMAGMSRVYQGVFPCVSLGY